MTIATTVDEQLIPLSQLVASPRNVRKKEPGNIEELAALIRAQGVLQNLSVIPQAPTGKKKAATGKFEVVAGGRRLRALNLLLERGEIDADYKVPCRVVRPEAALGISIAENSGREPLSVPDTIVAFHDMAQAGGSVEEIAVAFGVSPLTVQRRLKLANASPKMFELFKNEEMSLDQLKVLAMVDDHALQERVWESAADNWERGPHQLRRVLLGQGVDARNDPAAKFVGLQAYEAAGGTVVRDLFADEETGHIADVALLHDLARDRLEAAAVEVEKEGWKWVEARINFDYSERYKFTELTPSKRALTAEEQAKFDALEQKKTELENELGGLYDDQSAEDEEDETLGLVGDTILELERQVEEVDAAIEQIQNATRFYYPEAKASAGAVITIDRSGALTVIRGLVRAEDKADAKRASAGTTATTSAVDGDEDPAEPSRPVLSDALHRRLTAHRTQAIRAKMADNTHVALASVVFTLAKQVLLEPGDSYMIRSALDLRGVDQQHMLLQTADDLKGSAANVRLESKLLAWRERLPTEDGTTLLRFLIEQTDDRLLELLALCAAVTVNAVTGQPGVHPGDDLADALQLDMADWWSPTAASFLKHVPKALIVKAVSEAVSPEEGVALNNLKKGEAVAKAETLLAGKRWLPEPLRAPLS